MEMKSSSECVNFIDDMILRGKDSEVGIGNLDDLRDYMIGMYIDKDIEEMVSMLALLSQINLIIEKFRLDKESDIKKLYFNLRKHILD